jgi:hypothetical protein
MLRCGSAVAGSGVRRRFVAGSPLTVLAAAVARPPATAGARLPRRLAVLRRCLANRALDDVALRPATAATTIAIPIPIPSIPIAISVPIPIRSVAVAIPIPIPIPIRSVAVAIPIPPIPVAVAIAPLGMRAAVTVAAAVALAVGMRMRRALRPRLSGRRGRWCGRAAEPTEQPLP